MGTQALNRVSNSSDTPRASEEKLMAMSMGGGGASAPQMNVTPLIDVLLVLIIIFMVIVAQSKEKGFNAEIPQPPAMTDPQPVRTIVIQVGEPKSGEKPLLKINQQDVSWADLKAQLANIFKQRAEKIAFVQGEDAVDFEYVADVIDTARDAGVERVGLLPKEMASVR
jgi:biopolymer transport protein ExbD